MWAAYCAARGAATGAAERAPEAAGDGDGYSAWHFCDNKADADELARLVAGGRKRATAGSAWAYEAEDEPLPQVGDHSVITDWEGSPQAIIRTSSVEVVPFGRVTAEFAAAEGEGDLSLRYWREAHWSAFSRELKGIGREPAEDMPVVCERFEVVFLPGASPGPVEVLRAGPQEAALLTELGARTFRDTYAADNSPEDMESYLATWFSPAVQAQELAEEGTLFLIARVGGEAAGYARLRFGPAPDCVGGGRPVEIVRFYADLPWIGRGVGAALMRAVLEAAAERECDVVWLDVWSKNPRGIAFYSKWGFTEAGRQTFLLGADVQDDLLMVRAVGPDGRPPV